MSEITPTELQIWLEWAGARLIAMPGGKLKPAGPHVVWPEYSQNSHEILQFRGGLSLRAVAPSSQEIPIVDLILELPNLCAEPRTRRVIHSRSLVHPLNGRYLFKWSRIALMLHTNRTMVQKWYRDGVKEILKNADKAKICRISAFLGTP